LSLLFKWNRDVDMQWSITMTSVLVVVQRYRRHFVQCSRLPSYTCKLESPFTQVDDNGNLTVRVRGWNLVGNLSVDFRLHLNDIGL